MSILHARIRAAPQSSGADCLQGSGWLVEKSLHAVGIFLQDRIPAENTSGPPAVKGRGPATSVAAMRLR